MKVMAKKATRKVRFIRGISLPGKTYNPGEVDDIPADTARGLMKSGACSACRVAKKSGGGRECASAESRPVVAAAVEENSDGDLLQEIDRQESASDGDGLEGSKEGQDEISESGQGQEEVTE